MNSAPNRSEAALQFTLRKSLRKTVTAGKDFRCAGRFATAAAPLRNHAHTVQTPVTGGFRSD